MKNSIKQYFIAGALFLVILEILLLKGVIQIPNSINIGGLNIYFYSIFILIGAFIVVAGTKYFTSRDEKLKNLDIEELAIYSTITGIIGARLWHVVTDFPLYRDNPVEALYLWNGGLSIFGAVLGVILAIFIYSKVKKYDFVKIISYAAFFLPLAQFFGRFGNFINQELFGPPTDLPWGMFIRPENRPVEFEEFQFFHPLFLYEQILNLILFAINIYIYKRFNDFRLFPITWLIGYGVNRFLIEFLRDSPKDYLGMSVAQITSIIMVLLGLSTLLIKVKSERAKVRI